MKSVVLILVLLVPIVSISQTKIPDEKDLRKSIYFGGGSYYINELQIIGIRDFFDTIDNIENYEITISGHTDNIGGKEYNEWLSYMRSMSVKMQIIELEIPPEFIHLREFGQDNPLYDNDEWQGKRQNRRVDIILTPIVF